ncbi:MAG: hypothetical protein QXX45_03345 [Candidatus Aenigmatarchaeota archaeon]
MAEIGWNVAIIKDRAREMGINLSEEEANEILKKTFVQSMYGADPQKVISILESMKNRQSGSSYFSSSSSSSSSSSVEDEYINILNKLRSSIGGLPDISQKQEDIKKAYESIASTIEQQIPLISKIYENARQQLEKSQASEEEAVKLEGKKEEGQIRSALAAEGVLGATGASYYPIKDIEQKTTARIKEVADKYNLKYQDLANQMGKTVSDLTLEAQKFRAQGDIEASNLALKAAQLKLQEQQLLSQAASDILKAKTDLEKQALKNYYDQLILDLRERQLDISSQLAAAKIELIKAQTDLTRLKSIEEGKGSEFDELKDILKIIEAFK